MISLDKRREGHVIFQAFFCYLRKILIYVFFEKSGLGSSGHDFGHFPALCEGIFSGQLGLFRGYKKISSLER